MHPVYHNLRGKKKNSILRMCEKQQFFHIAYWSLKLRMVGSRLIQRMLYRYLLSMPFFFFDFFLSLFDVNYCQVVSHRILYTSCGNDNIISIRFINFEIYLWTALSRILLANYSSFISLCHFPLNRSNYKNVSIRGNVLMTCDVTWHLRANSILIIKQLEKEILVSW